MRSKVRVGIDEVILKLALAAFTAVLISLAWLQATSYGQTFIGKAVNGDGELEYIEHHYLEYENGQISKSRTIYYDADNNKVGDLSSEYSQGPQFGSYDFRDFRAEYQDGARVTPELIQLFRKDGSEEHIEETFLARDTDHIVGQGIHHFIANNLEAISRGDVIQVKMALPSRLDEYEFRIIKKDQESDRLHVRLEIDNWLLRVFAPHIDCEYDMKTRRLLRYEGISNIIDASGKHDKVVITYSYET